MVKFVILRPLWLIALGILGAMGYAIYSFLFIDGAGNLLDTDVRLFALFYALLMWSFGFSFGSAYERFKFYQNG